MAVLLGREAETVGLAVMLVAMELGKKQVRDLVITKIPFTMSSSHTSGVAAHEDKHTRAKGRIDGDS